MSKSERYLSVTEAAGALGVSAKALRLYEKKGLVKPTRSEAGWRFYGAEALMRLHQILALKSMGLELSTIARLLEGSLASLDSVLALQEQTLSAKRDEAVRSLALVREARSRLASGKALSVDDLTTLTRETTMSRLTPAELAEADRVSEAYLQSHFTPDEVTAIKRLREQPGLIEDWFEMLGSLQTAMALSDEACPAALDAARKFRVFLMRHSAGDPDFAQRLNRMFAELANDPAWANTAAARTALNAAQRAFLDRATTALKAQEAARKNA